MCPPREVYTLVIKSKDRVSGDANDYVVNIGSFLSQLTQYERFVGTLKEGLVHRNPFVAGYLEVKVDWHLPLQFETNNNGLPSVGMLMKTRDEIGGFHSDRRKFVFTRPNSSQLRIKMTTYDTEDDTTNVSDHCLVFEIYPLD